MIAKGNETYQNRVSSGVHEFLNKEGEDHLIIPIGMVQIDEKNKFVNTNTIDSLTFAKANRFKNGDVIDFEYELNFLRHYIGDKTIHNSNSVDRFYDRQEFNNTFSQKDLE
ncbi:MAG: hypothetical protein ACI87N_003599 [Flavobacteriales bacterium]